MRDEEIKVKKEIKAGGTQVRLVRGGKVAAATAIEGKIAETGSLLVTVAVAVLSEPTAEAACLPA